MKLVSKGAWHLITTDLKEADETALNKGLDVGVNGWPVKLVLDDSAGCRITSMYAKTTVVGHADAKA